MKLVVRSFWAVALLLLPTACSGGGGSSSVVPSTSPSPGSSASPLPSCGNSVSVASALHRSLASVPNGAATAVPDTVYQLTSYPSGARLTNNGVSLGTTPYSFNPQYSSVANFMTFSSGTSSYTLCLTQSGYPSRTILYNAAGDTSGSISSVVTTSSFQRRSLSGQASITALPVAHHGLRLAQSTDIDSTRLLVKYRANVLQSSNRSMLSIERAAGVLAARNLGPQNTSLLSRIVRVPTGKNAQTLVSTLAQDPAVESVSPIHHRWPLSVSPVMPNDPEFTKDQIHQWDLYQTQAPLAWGITEGSPSVAVAIIDTGYDSNNPDLQGSKVTYAESVIDGVTTTGAAAALDTDGHGSNVSGIAAADTNNAVAVAGVGFNVSLQEYRIFISPSDPNYAEDLASCSSGSPCGSVADEAQAIYDAVSHNAKVISLSLGGVAASGIDQGEYDAVEYAISQGVTVVAAVGNERLSGVNTIDFPAAYPGVIAVGASALDDSASPQVRSAATEYVASYSNSGPSLSLVAPGGDASGTNDDDPMHWILNLDTSQPASGTPCAQITLCLGYFEGTSQATPHVAGTAALMYSLNPNLTPAQVKSILMANADNINDPRQGAGRLNMYRSLAAVAGISAPTAPGYSNFVAFGYTNSGGTVPTIVDVNFPNGVPVNADGTFRLPDINPNAGTYNIAVWSDVNGNGVIDAGDYFGVAATGCQATTPCTIAATGITASVVASGFTLP